MYMKDDLVYLIAKPSSLEKIKELGGKRDHHIKNAMILGGGRIGKRAAINLQNDIDLTINLFKNEELKIKKKSEATDSVIYISPESCFDDAYENFIASIS